MKEKLIKTIDLENGMQLKLYDASKKLAGDRWLVSAIIKMEIPVKEIMSKKNDVTRTQLDNMVDMLGEAVHFEQKTERIFIDKNEKEQVFDEISHHFITSTIPYLSRQAFCEQFILKKYNEKMK